MGLSQFDETFPVNVAYELGIGSTTVPHLIVNAAQGTIRVDKIWLTQDDTIDHVATLSYNSNYVNYPLGSVNVPAGAGHNGVPSIELLSAVLGSPNDGIVVAWNDGIAVGVELTMSGATTMGIAAFGGTV